MRMEREIGGTEFVEWIGEINFSLSEIAFDDSLNKNLKLTFWFNFQF
jgi:hypothetical protein